MKKIIYSNIKNNETQHIVDHLQKKANWTPVLFHGEEDMKDLIEEKYLNAKLVDSTKLRQGFFDYSLLGNEIPIDSEILENLSKYESNFMSWLQDTNGWNFSYFQRRRYYYDILRYWNTVICNLKPDIFVSYTWPHVQSDYALYLLCKYHYKIPVIFIDITPFFDKYYYTSGSTLEDLSCPFKEYYLSKDNLEINEIVIEYLKKLRSSSPSTPKHIKKHFNHLDSESNNKKRYLEMLYLVCSGKALRKSNSSFKSNKKIWGTDSSIMSLLNEFFFRERMILNNKIVKKFYMNLISEPNKFDNYIYFAAPYQPEAISNISCGKYEDSILIIDQLSKAIPRDWKIYYKEHPNTFKDLYKGTLIKNKNFYKRILKFKNVKFISDKVDTFKLIDGSQAVATVGGTVGWEAIVRGKPALIFGNIWYQACKSIFAIKTHYDLLQAISKILDGYKPCPKDVDRYAQSVFLASVKDLIVVKDFKINISKIDNPSEEMNRVGDFLLESYKKYYQH